MSEMELMSCHLGGLLGEGRSAEVFAFGEQEVIKLLREGWGLDQAQREIDRTKKLAEYGIKVPRVKGLVRVGRRTGVVFDRIFGRCLTARSKNLPEEVRLMARWQYGIHQVSAPKLPSFVSMLSNNIRSLPGLPLSATQELLRVLYALPQGGQVCHGDFGPHNIIVTESGKPVFLDWYDGAQGNPLADVANTYFWLVNAVSTSIGNLFVDEYLDFSDASRSELEQWKIVVAASSLQTADCELPNVLLQYLNQQGFSSIGFPGRVGE